MSQNPPSAGRPTNAEVRTVAKSESMLTSTASALPEYLFYLLILCLPFEELGTVGGLALTKVIGLVFFVCSFLSPKQFFGSIPKPFLAFAAYIGIGMVIDIASFPLVPASLNELVRPLLMCVLMVAAYNLSINNKAGRVVAAIWLSSFVYAIAQLLEFRGVTRVESTVIDGFIADRVAVLGGDENFAACFISLGILGGAVYGFSAVASQWRHRVLALAGSAVGFLALLRTGSRGGLAALFVGMIGILYTTVKWSQRAKYLLVLAVLLAAMSLGVMHNSSFKARVLSSIETGETAGRTYIWTEAVRLFAESPVYGFGYRMQQFKLGERTGHEMRGTHNLFLSVLLGSGILGFSFFFYFYVQSFKAIWRHRAEGVNPVIFAWFLMALAGSLCINTEIAKWFWLIVALAIGAGRAQRRPLKFAKFGAGNHHALTRAKGITEIGALGREQSSVGGNLGLKVEERNA